MDKATNQAHWRQLARSFGEHLAATTKCRSIKELELATLSKAIRDMQSGMSAGQPSLIVEAGCGNGINMLGLMDRFPNCSFLGIDFVADMCANGLSLAQSTLGVGSTELERLAFCVGDVRHFQWPPQTADGFVHCGSKVRDLMRHKPTIVYSDRCLINLADVSEQAQAIRKIVDNLAEGGQFLMLENSVQTADRLNDIRESLGLPRRPSAEYNVFIDEEALKRELSGSVVLRDVRDFGGLHDLVIYALQAVTNEGEVLYDTDLMRHVTTVGRFLIEQGIDNPPVGQNRLWIWQR